MGESRGNVLNPTYPDSKPSMPDSASEMITHVLLELLLLRPRALCLLKPEPRSSTWWGQGARFDEIFYMCSL